MNSPQICWFCLNQYNEKENLLRFRSISALHQAFGLPKPQHPLISLTHFDENNPFNPDNAPIYDVLNFYKITCIVQNSGRLKYGQSYSVYHMIEQELNSRVDEFSQEIVIAQVELLLSYASCLSAPSLMNLVLSIRKVSTNFSKTKPGNRPWHSGTLF